MLSFLKQRISSIAAFTGVLLMAFQPCFAQPNEPISSLPAQKITTRFPGREPASAPPSKGEILTRLRNLQARQVLEINTLEDSIRKAMKDSISLNLKEELNLANRKISKLSDLLGDYDKRHSELLARRQFIDQLIFLIDSKWTGQPLQAFLEHGFLDLAVNDLTSPQGSNDSWRFLTYLSIAIREVPEPRDDLFGIIENYMNFASVTNPRTPAEYLATRQYTSGSESASAHPVDRANLGEFLEKRTKELGRPGPPSAKIPEPAPIEIRMNLPKTDTIIERQTPGTTLPPASPPIEDEKPEPMYISPRFKAIN